MKSSSAILYGITPSQRRVLSNVKCGTFPLHSDYTPFYGIFQRTQINELFFSNEPKVKLSKSLSLG